MVTTTKRFLVALLILSGLFLANIGQTGLPPTTLKGLLQSAASVTFNFFTPKNQTTKVTGGTLIETGNLNLLVNPDQEQTGTAASIGAATSTTVNGWTLTTTGTTTCILTQETTLGFEGDGKWGLISATGGASGGTCSYKQSILTTSGQQALMKSLVYAQAMGTCSGPTTAFYTLSAGNRVTSADITNCGTTPAWSSVAIPDITGSTTGLEFVITVGAGQSAALGVDRTYMGVGDPSTLASVITPWRPYTPIFTGFGTVTCADCMEWRQVGSGIEIRGKFVSGTSTAVEARMSLPNSFTSSAIPSIQVVGTNTRAPTTSTETYWMLAEPSVSYLTFGYQSTTTSPLTKQNGSFLAAATNTFSLNASVPIANLTGSTQVFSSQCGAACENHLTADLTSAGAITNQTPTWVTGAATVATGQQTVPVTGFTVVPNCGCSRTSGDGECNYIKSSSTTSSLLFQSENSAGTTLAGSMNIWCDKVGADYITARTIVGTFKEVMTAPGVSKPKVCYANYGGASATLLAPTVCSTGACVETLDTCLAFTPPSFSSTGTYTGLTIANGTFANSSAIYCSCEAFGASTGAARKCSLDWRTGQSYGVTSGSGGYITNVNTTTLSGTPENLYYQVKCEGQAP